MTEKEKANAYDEAIKRAKKSYGNRIAEEIFPELKEDDDERIKKNCIHFLELQKQHHAATFEIEECIDWLEKQGKQEEPQVYETKDSKIIKYSETDGYKFVDPNFHEGDWVVYNNDVCQIVKREEGCNKLVTVFGIEKELVNESNLSTARLWTIQDAKDGDVICYRDEISLYKCEIKNDNKQDTTFGGFIYYCCYDGKNFITNSFYLLTEQEEIDIYPATKEQREILMKAMNNAGYEFDIEKKELKKFVHNKFDPKTLEPFDKILVRRTNENHDVWFPDFVSDPPDDTSNKTLCMCIMEDILMVIPYNDETKHLIGTSDEAPEYYRYWED